MQPHWHISIENFLIVGVSAVVFINLARLGSARLQKSNGKLGEIGTAFGALVA